MKDAAFFSPDTWSLHDLLHSCGETGQLPLNAEELPVSIRGPGLCDWQQAFGFRQCHCRGAKCRGVQSCQEHLSHWLWKVPAGTSECIGALGLVWMNQEKSHMVIKKTILWVCSRSWRSSEKSEVDETSSLKCLLKSKTKTPVSPAACI